jgi:hypothetical protein
LWGLGSSLVENVTQNATSFVNTIVETDWQKELSDIQEGLRTETAELEQHVGRQLGIEGSESGPTAWAQDQDGAISIADLSRRFISGTAEIFHQVRRRICIRCCNIEWSPHVYRMQLRNLAEQC